MIDKYKTYIIYTFIALVVFFCMIWTLDALNPNISPAYNPFLQFLNIMKDILKMVITDV